MGTKPRTTFVIPTVETRVDDLNELVRSIIRKPELDDIDICIILQDKVGGAIYKIENKERITQIVTLDKWVGIHNARIKLLEDIYCDYDVFINMDDDMLVGSKTNYERAIKLCQNKYVGFVMTAWKRTQDQLEKAEPSDKLRKQICLYQGGGMVYSKKIAKLMLEFGECKTGHDMWSLLAYIKGYDNYYDYSSYTLHKVCQSGGLSLWHGSIGDNDLMLSEYVNVRYAKRRRGNGHDILIPLDQDVNERAKKSHKIQRELLEF